jgi:predicted site-specific integrase-resolvase
MEVANIYEYDYSGYDVAVLMEVLEHLDGDLDLLARIKSGTLVYATVPYADQRADITHVREYTEAYARERYSKVLDVKSVERFEQFIVIYGVKL